MPIHSWSIWGDPTHERDLRNEAVSRYLVEEERHGRHDSRRNGPPFVSETSLRHLALQQEAASMHLTREAHRARRVARPSRAGRRRPRVVLMLQRALQWRPFV